MDNRKRSREELQRDLDEREERNRQITNQSYAQSSQLAGNLQNREAENNKAVFEASQFTATISVLEKAQDFLQQPLKLSDPDDGTRKSLLEAQKNHEAFKNSLPNPTQNQRDYIQTIDATFDHLHSLNYIRTIELRVEKQMQAVLVTMESAMKNGDKKGFTEALGMLEKLNQSMKKEGGELSSLRSAARNQPSVKDHASTIASHLESKLEQIIDLAVDVHKKIEKAQQAKPAQQQSTPAQRRSGKSPSEEQKRKMNNDSMGHLNQTANKSAVDAVKKGVQGLIDFQDKGKRDAMVDDKMAEIARDFGVRRPGK